MEIHIQTPLDLASLKHLYQKIGTQWVHESTVVNKAGQTLVDRSLLVLKTQMNDFHKEKIHSSQAVCMDSGHKWR